MKQTQTTPTPPKDDPQRMSLSSLWNLWVDNLKEWHFYLVEEHGHRQRADISGWIDRLRLRCRSFMSSLRRDGTRRTPAATVNSRSRITASPSSASMWRAASPV